MIPRITITSDLPANVNARHNLWGIRIRPDLAHFDAILAQERFEWWFLRKWGAVMALPFVGAAVMFSPWLAMGAIVAFLVGPEFVPPLKRRMELIGHAIEVLWATEIDGADRAAYFAGEVHSLKTYPQFKGWTEERITLALIKAEPAARKWLPA